MVALARAGLSETVRLGLVEAEVGGRSAEKAYSARRRTIDVGAETIARSQA